MGVSYDIGCKTCKKSITVGHKSYLCDDDVDILEFLKDHKGNYHVLVFDGDDTSTFDEIDNVDEEY